MKIPIGARLLACCDYVNQNDRIADVGCDHGYLSIHLLRSGIARSAIASDVNKQPLMSAIRNAERFGFREKMEFYLSDGVGNIPRDFDTMVCAGMGADTMISILNAAPWLKDGKHRLVLQCQSKIPELRKYLSQEGWHIRRENLVKDGRFLYPVMEVTWEPAEPLTPAQCYLTPALAESGSPLLREYRERILHSLGLTASGLARSADSRLKEYQSILKELEEQ